MVRIGLVGKLCAKPLPAGQMTKVIAIKMPLIMSLLLRFDDSSESRAEITLPTEAGSNLSTKAGVWQPTLPFS